MTFTIPETVAREFQVLIPNRKRSGLVARLLKDELTKCREDLITACKAASADKETEKTIKEWQGFDEKIEGPGW